MEEEDYAELLRFAQEQLAALGLGDLADDEHYVDPERPFDLPPPDKHLVAMLQNVESWLTLLDGRTVKEALGEIREICPDGPTSVDVLMPEWEGGRRVDLLEDLSDQSAVQNALNNFISRLLDGDLRPQSGPRI